MAAAQSTAGELGLPEDADRKQRAAAFITRGENDTTYSVSSKFEERWVQVPEHLTRALGTST